MQSDKIKNVKAACSADDLGTWMPLPKQQEQQLSQTMNAALTTLSTWCKENATRTHSTRAIKNL